MTRKRSAIEQMIVKQSLCGLISVEEPDQAMAQQARKEFTAAARNRLHIDGYTEVATPEAVLALLDALEKTEHSWKTTAKGYKRLEAECERLKAWKAEASAVLKDHHDALQRHGKLGEGPRQCMDRMAAELAEAVGLLRRARETKILKHWPSCDVTPCHCLLEDIDRLVAQHQRPPEGA